MWNMKYNSNEPMKQNHGHNEQADGCQRRVGGGIE